MSKKGKDAYNKGRSDWGKSKGMANMNPITDFFHNGYRPPSGQKAAYDAGRRDAKRDSKK